MEQNEKRKNDLRTFFIALLTAVIVVALYHFGMGLCRTFCDGPAAPRFEQRCPMSFAPGQPMPVYVPVMVMPQQPQFQNMRHQMPNRDAGFRHNERRPEFKGGENSPAEFKGRDDAKPQRNGEFRQRKDGKRFNRKAGEVKPQAPAEDQKAAPETTEVKAVENK